MTVFALSVWRSGTPVGTRSQLQHTPGEEDVSRLGSDIRERSIGQGRAAIDRPCAPHRETTDTAERRVRTRVARRAAGPDGNPRGAVFHQIAISLHGEVKRWGSQS